MTTPFLIGSHVYGTPRPDSDIDLVVRMTGKLAIRLYELAGVNPHMPLRFGSLNIIPAVTDEEYEAWMTGLREVLQLQEDSGEPVTREQAVRIFKRQRDLKGQPS